LLGFERNLTHLDGHVVSLKREGVTQPSTSHTLPLMQEIKLAITDFVQVVKGEGMPRFDNPSLHGDLYVEYTVVFPATLSNDQKRSKSLSNILLVNSV
jgi:DnaJ-related protein SCJ1